MSWALPNAARLSVRFFLHNTFKGVSGQYQAHYRRLEIVRPAYDKFETLSLWAAQRDGQSELQR